MAILGAHAGREGADPHQPVASGLRAAGDGVGQGASRDTKEHEQPGHGTERSG